MNQHTPCIKSEATDDQSDTPEALVIKTSKLSRGLDSEKLFVDVVIFVVQIRRMIRMSFLYWVGLYENA